MSLRITHEETKGYILLIPDVISKESMRIAIPKIIELMIANNCFVTLSDCRKSTMPMNTLDIMDLQNMWKKAFITNGILPSKPKGAIILHKNRRLYANLHFFETISINRNLKVKTFFELSAAKNWLTKD